MIKIAYASENDVSRIVEIMQDALTPIWTSDAFLSEMRKSDSLFMVALRDDNIIGFAIIRQVGDDGELLQIAVDKSARRCGIGDLLMEAVLKYAVESKHQSVFLEVRCSNDAAVKLYEKHGFEPVRTRKDYYNDPVEDALIMMKRVKEWSE